MNSRVVDKDLELLVESAEPIELSILKKFSNGIIDRETTFKELDSAGVDKRRMGIIAQFI